jgi:hypothetical protein
VLTTILGIVGAVVAHFALYHTSIQYVAPNRQLGQGALHSGAARDRQAYAEFELIGELEVREVREWVGFNPYRKPGEH